MASMPEIIGHPEPWCNGHQAERRRRRSSPRCPARARATAHLMPSDRRHGCVNAVFQGSWYRRARSGRALAEYAGAASGSFSSSTLGSCPHAASEGSPQPTAQRMSGRSTGWGFSTGRPCLGMGRERFLSRRESRNTLWSPRLKRRRAWIDFRAAEVPISRPTGFRNHGGQACHLPVTLARRPPGRGTRRTMTRAPAHPSAMHSCPANPPLAAPCLPAACSSFGMWGLASDDTPSLTWGGCRTCPQDSPQPSGPALMLLIPQVLAGRPAPRAGTAIWG